MEQKYIVGIDVGSQSAKILIYDLEGNIVAKGKKKLAPMNLAKPGIVEHPDDDLWDSLCVASRIALGDFKGDVQDIIGIGINGVDAVSELSKAQATGFYGSLLPSPDVHGYKSSEMLYNWVAKDVEPPKFTEVTDVVLITRDNFKEELEKKGLGGK